VKVKGVASVYLSDLDVYIGSSAKTYPFTTCGLMFDKQPTENTGILRLSVGLPHVAYDLHHWHYTSGPFHGTGSATGYVAIHIEVPIHYSVKPPSLRCEDLAVTVTYVSLALNGLKGMGKKVGPKLIPAIKGQIKKQVASIAQQKVCPAANQKFQTCLAASTEWPDIIACLTKKQAARQRLAVGAK